MIARIWHGRTLDQLGDEYFEYIKKTGIKGYRSTKGNRGAYVLRRIEKGVTEFLLITLWDSSDAIKKFSGPDMEKAVYFPDDRKYLLELEPLVDHFEVLLASNSQYFYNEGSISSPIIYMKGIRY
ncbi:MAG: antibiotic biosynthesis monooxygenase [Candidatus Aminicenantes bacterium]|nr:MAG: antibiotic biosynthesis monooxygenase [Candidatus Aminicenantes bacterium]